MTSAGTLTPVKITLPPLHRGQLTIAQSPARFKVVVCGRRFGKTTYGVRECVKGALETGGLFWWIGPSYKVASIGWKMLKFLGRQIPDTEIREADMALIFSNGGQVAIRSADNPDSLRGEKLWGVVFDEFPQIREETWTEVIRPSLSDMKGWALFIGTPKGKNWAYRLFEAAKVRPNWAAFQMPTRTNPVIDPEEIEAARIEMSDESFKQEYEADFGASQYLVYSEIVPDIHEWRDPVPEFISYHGGMDFGGDTIGAHKSCVAIAGRTSKDELIIFDAFQQSGPNIGERQLNWTLETDQKIAQLHKQKPIAQPIYRGDKSQALGIQFMRRMGVAIFPTVGGKDSVQEGIELMHRRLKLREDKRPRLFVLKGCPWVLDALMRYRYPEPRPDDKPQATNPLKVDDDMADTVRYLVEGVDRQVIGDPQKLYSPLIPRIVG